MNSIRTDAPSCERTSQERQSLKATSQSSVPQTCQTDNATSSLASAASGSRANGPASTPLCGPEAFPARTCPVPAREPDLMGSVPACGSSGCGLFGHEDPFGCSLRTYLLCELADTTGYTMRWKRKATPSGRSWWVLRLSARQRSRRAPGLLPRPTKSWGRHGIGVSMRTVGRYAKDTIQNVIAINGGTGKPRPETTEWLMGYPIGWTELKPSETPSSLRLPRQS